MSWSRVKPLGGKDDPVNEKGIGYYNNLVSNSVTPFVLLFRFLLSAFAFISLNYGSSSSYTRLIFPAFDCRPVVRSTPS